jgi:hypothetical protein
LDLDFSAERLLRVDSYGVVSGLCSFSRVDKEAVTMARDLNAKMFAILMLCGIIGIIFAIIEQMLYANGTLSSSLLSGLSITLAEFQLATILLWEIFGLILAALL